MKINAAAVSLAVMAWAGWVQAADWPQWRGINRDGHVPAGEKGLTNLPVEIKPRWRIDVGEGFASPVVVGAADAGRIYYIDLQDGKEVVHAAEANTGKELGLVEQVFKSDVDQDTLPVRAPVVGPGYQTNPEN